MGLIAALKSSEGTSSKKLFEGTHYLKHTKMQLIFLSLLMIASANSKAMSQWSESNHFRSRIARAVDGFDHTKMHCNDVSTYDSVALRSKQCNKCEAKFPKRTEPRTEMICKTVPSLRCDLEGYVKCDMEMVPSRSHLRLGTVLQIISVLGSVLLGNFASHLLHCFDLRATESYVETSLQCILV